MDDADGRLMGEYGASITSPVAEAIWLSPDVADASLPVGGDDGVGGYAPLAVVTGSGSSLAVNWVHGNHLGVQNRHHQRQRQPARNCGCAKQDETPDHCRHSAPQLHPPRQHRRAHASDGEHAQDDDKLALRDRADPVGDARAVSKRVESLADSEIALNQIPRAADPMQSERNLL